MLPSLSKASNRSLAQGSTGLAKSSIISIAKKSLYSTSADGQVQLTVYSDDELPWHAIPDASIVVDELASSASTGLSSAEAARRLEDFGPNSLTPTPKPGFFARLWNQLNNILIYILFAAAIVKGALQSWPAFGLVLAVIVINTAMGLLQEGRAEKAADAIKAMLSSNAVVLRDGERKTIPSEELVPGDIVIIKSGDKIPADLRLIQANNLQLQEAMLTGESVPVAKTLQAAAANASLGDRKCMCYSATNVSAGQGLGVVVGTGDSAEIGLINKMVNTVDNIKNNLTHQLEILGRWLAIFVAVLAIISFLLALFVADQNFKTAFESAVAIAVAIIPEGLPAMVTIVLSIGTTVMARKNAIIRQLPAVETLGSLNVICSDKTGTLTKNEMTVVSLRTAAGWYAVSGVGYAPEGTVTAADRAPLPDAQMGNVRRLIEGTVLCNDSDLSKATDESSGKVTYLPLGAPTEVALLTLGEKVGLRLKETKAKTPRVASVPFESEHKFMVTVHDEGGKRVMYVKGAPDRLLPLCKSQLAGNDWGEAVPLQLEFWQATQAEMSKKGLRVLALCRAELAVGEDLGQLSAQSILRRGKFLTMGMMMAILDPPREEAITAIAQAHKAGIVVKMITGDHSLTALAIAGTLGIAGKGLVLTGPQLDAMDEGALAHVVTDCNVFARASPENKLRIVRALQTRKQIVAMTGDGVNDAPALKAADVGVAMGITGTDVSKEAAKMVLADDNFASIVSAVEEGRRVWDNIRKILVFNLPVNLAQGTSVLYAYIIGLRDVPLTALQVLLVNLVTSITLGLALAAEPAEPTVMTRPPRRANKRLVGKLLLWRCFFVCHAVVVLVLGMFYWAGQTGASLGQQRAEAFAVLVGCQVVYFINCRFLKASTLHPRVFKGNWLMYPVTIITVGLMLFFTFCPGVNTFFQMDAMTGLQWARVVVSMVALYLLVEVEKALVDPVLMPIIRPVLAFIERHTPDWLAVNRSSINWIRRCRRPQVGPKRAIEDQRRGTVRKLMHRATSEEVVEGAPAAAAAAGAAGASGGIGGVAERQAAPAGVVQIGQV